nr:hypothetical protein [Tranquillimonas alkanivorans]
MKIYAGNLFADAVAQGWIAYVPIQSRSVHQPEILIVSVITWERNQSNLSPEPHRKTNRVSVRLHNFPQGFLLIVCCEPESIHLIVFSVLFTIVRKHSFLSVPMPRVSHIGLGIDCYIFTQANYGLNTEAICGISHPVIRFRNSERAGWREQKVYGV